MFKPDLHLNGDGSRGMHHVWTMDVSFPQGLTEVTEDVTKGQIWLYKFTSIFTSHLNDPDIFLQKMQGMQGRRIMHVAALAQDIDEQWPDSDPFSD